MSERINSEKKLISWLYDSGASWRLMTNRWLDLKVPTKEDYLNAVLEDPLKSVLDSASSTPDWGGKSRYYREKYNGLAWRIQLMGDLGADCVIPKVGEAVENFLSWSLSPEGGLGYSKDLPPFPCISGNLLASMVHLGYGNDKRLLAIGDWLAGEVREDGGWLCPARMQNLVTSGTHSCFTATYHATAGLVSLNSKSKNHQASRLRGIEFMLNHRLFRSDRSSRILCSRWLETGYPSFNYYSLLKGAHLVVSAGCASDSRCDEAFDHLMAARQPDGTWLQGWVPTQPTPYRGAAKGKPDRAVTIISWATLAKAGRLSPPQLDLLN